MEILLGADPECFVKKDGKHVSAYNLVPGTKTNPYKVEGGAVQVDGMALEFNIDPAKDEDMFLNSIQSVVGQLAAMVPEYELDAVPVAMFGAEYIAGQPVEARELGCEPDFNAWENGAVNVPPNEDLPFRTGAGHVHVGWTEGADITDQFHDMVCQQVIKQLDFYLGLPSLFFDDNTMRREMYGKAGAYRPKSYGAEYRVLSNKWITSPTLTRWVFRAAKKALDELHNENCLAEKYGDISEIINTSNKREAMKIIKREGLEVPSEA